MALFGYLVICVFAFVVTCAGFIMLLLGGTDMSNAPKKVWAIILPSLTGMWYWVYTIAPFELVIK